MCSAAEAIAYAKSLHTLVRWIGICDGNMQEGSFRCDVNVSVRKPGGELGTRREIKNLNSFKFMQQAIDYEVQWQIDTLENGGKIQQATVLFNPDTGETRSMRSKEDAHDYRYFPDPDLLPLEISKAWIEQLRATMPELPLAMQTRYVKDMGLSLYDAMTLTSSREMAEFFEGATSCLPTQSKLIANWIMGEISALLARDKLEIVNSPVSAPWLAGLLTRVSDGTINVRKAKEILDGAWGRNQLFAVLTEAQNAIDAEIEAKGLKQVSDVGALEAMVDEIIAANADKVAEYRSGKDKLFGFFVGLAMKASKGKANPAQMNEILRKKLAG